jgi:hypothetical protein
MVDMWMLSVAAALIDRVEEAGPVAKLEQAVRGLSGLGEALDAARQAAPADKIRLAEALADGLKAAYDGGGAFPILLETLWPEVLFGPKAGVTGNVAHGTIGNLVQAKVIDGGIRF